MDTHRFQRIPEIDVCLLQISQGPLGLIMPELETRSRPTRLAPVAAARLQTDQRSRSPLSSCTALMGNLVIAGPKSAEARKSCARMDLAEGRAKVSATVQTSIPPSSTRVSAQPSASRFLVLSALEPRHWHRTPPHRVEANHGLRPTHDSTNAPPSTY